MARIVTFRVSWTAENDEINNTNNIIITLKHGNTVRSVKGHGINITYITK